MKLLMKKWLPVAVSGLLIGFSFPTFLFGHKLPNLGFLAWFGLAPLLWLLKNVCWKRAFLYGWLTSMIYFFFSFHWLYIALHVYGYLNPVVSVLIPLLLASVLALYVGAACALAKGLEKNCGAPFLFLFPAAFTLFEWARNYTPFNGFPWGNLTMSQASYTWLIQISDITGVYGVIFLVALINVWLTESFWHLRQKEISKYIPKTILMVCLVGFVLGYGALRCQKVTKETKEAPRMKIGLIQPNIPQDEKWDPASMEKQVDFFAQAVESLEKHVDLIVWPEAGFTKVLNNADTFLPPAQIGISQEGQAITLLGATTESFTANRRQYYNSAVLVHSSGIILGRYHKTHLVPFGEYIPLEKLFPFLKPLAVIGDFAPGLETEPLALADWNVAPLICYEDIFPELSRSMVRQNAHLLINMTNDAWYGYSSAPFQHVAMAQFRSAETKRAMVRATNTGVSAIIDPAGRLLLSTPIFERGVISYQVPLLTGQTLYVKFGDWFVAACFLFLTMQTILCLKNSKKI